MPETRIPRIRRGNSYRLIIFFLAYFFGFFVSNSGMVPPIAQKPEAKIQIPVLQHEVAVTLKLIQVYVVDKKGNAVPGLTAADFEIKDEGKPVSITDFEYHAAEFPGSADKSPVLVAAAAPAKLKK